MEPEGKGPPGTVPAAGGRALAPAPAPVPPYHPAAHRPVTGRTRLPNHLPRGTQRRLVCRPPTGPSPARAPQGHLQPGTGPKSLRGPQPHDSPQPRDVHPGCAWARPWGLRAPPSPSNPKEPALRVHPSAAGGWRSPIPPFGTLDTRTWAGAARYPPLPLFAIKGIFDAAFGISLQFSHGSRAVLWGTNCGEQRRKAEQKA